MSNDWRTDSIIAHFSLGIKKSEVKPLIRVLNFRFFSYFVFLISIHRFS